MIHLATHGVYAINGNARDVRFLGHFIAVWTIAGGFGNRGFQTQNENPSGEVHCKLDFSLDVNPIIGEEEREDGREMEMEMPFCEKCVTLVFYFVLLAMDQVPIPGSDALK
jgi:hypothetical protein